MSLFTQLVFDECDKGEGEDIQLEEFLTKAKGATVFCDALGSTFYLTKKDIEGNIGKLEEAMKNLPKQVTINQMLEFEIKMKTAKNSSSGSVGLLWLWRGLRFIHAMIQNILLDEQAGKEDSMKAIAKDAYEKTLRPHHNALIAPMIKTWFAALPKRSALLKSMGNGVTIEQELTEMGVTVNSLTPVLARLKEYLIEYKQITDPSKD